jgi:hypothetical protein
MSAKAAKIGIPFPRAMRRTAGHRDHRKDNLKDEKQNPRRSRTIHSASELEATVTGGGER